MAVTYLKNAGKTSETETESARQVVSRMLAEIELHGEEAVRRYALELDHWSGPIVVTPEEIARRVASVPESVRADIVFAVDNVRRFAEAQRQSVQAFSLEVVPGLWAGQKLVPCNVAGCYVPTGRYAHIASAYMSIATAKAAATAKAVTLLASAA